ncbi:phosphatidylserine decarboxylase family protein [Candidatus Woesearchaeota archaeon]|nr:phosphatidylserine decarboxylase family protein [Candidatus Woesearchaeota archaeon]
MNIFLVVFIIIVLLALLFLLQFHRDPKRKIPEGKVMVSPADGWVIAIIDLKEKKELTKSGKGIKDEREKVNKEMIKDGKMKIDKGVWGKISTMTKDTPDARYLISIFMTVFDVHINRSPVDGKIVKITREKGGFKNAKNLEALENEKVEYIIENKDLGKIKVIQIAGFLARRIIPWKKVNESVKKGERIGKITFGSQVTLIIPKMRLNIKEGQHVKAGTTILAEYL